MASKKSKGSHVVVGDGGRLICLHCGKTHTPLELPVEVWVVSAIWKAFAKSHANCPKPPRARCGVCLTLDHATSEHVHRDPHAWMRSSDTGISSRAIWYHMMGLLRTDSWGSGPPMDPADFGRCHRLLVAFPEWRARIGEMAKYRSWEKLAPAWDELEALYVEEVASGSAPKLYARMRALEGRE